MRAAACAWCAFWHVIDDCQRHTADAQHVHGARFDVIDDCKRHTADARPRAHMPVATHAHMPGATRAHMPGATRAHMPGAHGCTMGDVLLACGRTSGHTGFTHGRTSGRRVPGARRWFDTIDVQQRHTSVKTAHAHA
eukprot:350083-Chlamydomonas_euryale.AAC.1